MGLILGNWSPARCQPDPEKVLSSGEGNFSSALPPKQAKSLFVSS